MKKTIPLCLLFLALAPQPAWPETEGPPLSQEDRAVLLDKQVLKRNPNASVEIVRNETEVWVDEKGNYRRTTRKTVKLLDEQAKDAWSQQEETYQAKAEELDVDFARTVTPDGGLIPVRASDIKEITPYSRATSYSRIKSKIINFPQMTLGSMLDYSTTLHCRRPFLDGDFTDRFFFRGTQPGRGNSYILHLPKTLALRHRILHPDPLIPTAFTEEDEGKSICYRWKSGSSGQLLVEPNQISLVDIVPSLILSTAKGWDDYTRWFFKITAGHAEPDPSVTALAKSVTEGLSSPRARAKALFQWVVKNIRYVNVDMNIAGFEPQKAGEVLRNRYGDCKDGTTLLLALLKAADIPAYYVLLKTNGSRLVPDFVGYQFDHVIAAAKIGEKLVYLDQVAKNAPYGVLPSMDRGTRPLVMDPQKPFFSSIPYAKGGEEYQETSKAIILDAAGNAKTTVVERGNGDLESELRSSFTDRTPEEIKSGFQKVVQDEAGELLDYHLSDPLDLDRPFRCTYRYRTKGLGILAGNLMLVQPPISYGMNAFKEPIRRFPVKARQGYFVDRLSLAIPRGFRVRYLPRAVRQDSPYLSFRGGYRVEKGCILFEGISEYKGKELPPKDYASTRSLFLKRSQLGQEMLVLQRITGKGSR